MQGMPVTDFRQRTAVLFIAVVLGHIILISAQVNSRAGVPLLEVVTFGAFAEVRFATPRHDREEIGCSGLAKSAVAHAGLELEAGILARASGLR